MLIGERRRGWESARGRRKGRERKSGREKVGEKVRGRVSRQPWPEA